jgi:N-acetylglucosamine kinase-like BadF-type ATPase
MGVSDDSHDVVLAIDAGNSKTDVALVAADGRLLATSRGDGFRPHRVGAESAVAGLAPLVEDVLGEHSRVRHLSACLANVDLPVEHHALEAALAARAWATSCEVVNDTFALLRAGLDERRGVAVICGAGINATGILPDGTTVRFAAVGTISGDWGGGAFLWQEAMWWAARAEDGRGSDTELRTALPAHLGLTSMAELIEAVHLGQVSDRRCAELTPLLFAVAARGDDVAGRIVRRQAEEVVALVVATLRRLGVLGEPMDVVLGGGVLTAGHPQLMDEIERLLLRDAPGARTRVVAAPPVVGAALLALDRVGAPPDAHARLRASFAG